MKIDDEPELNYKPNHVPNENLEPEVREIRNSINKSTEKLISSQNTFNKKMLFYQALLVLGTWVLAIGTLLVLWCK